MYILWSTYVRSGWSIFPPEKVSGFAFEKVSWWNMLTTQLSYFHTLGFYGVVSVFKLFWTWSSRDLALGTNHQFSSQSHLLKPNQIKTKANLWFFNSNRRVGLWEDGQWALPKMRVLDFCFRLFSLRSHPRHIEIHEGTIYDGQDMP